MKPIPTTDYGWLDYQDKVLLLKPDNGGNVAIFQADGTNCRQCSINGFVVKEFLVDYRWFKEDWWYKLTRWYEDAYHTSKVMFFCTRQYERIVNKLVDLFNPDGLDLKGLDNFIEEVKSKAKPSDNILKLILKHASKRMSLKLIADFDDSDYGLHWYESYIPVKTIDNEKYILSWMNCD